MNFKESLRSGKETENEILNIIKSKYPDAYIYDGYKKEWDIIIPELRKTVEVKRDYKSNYTGNYVVEVYMFGKPSGVITTTADYWVFSDGKKYTWIKPGVIKNIILVEGYHQREFIGDGDVESKRAYLVPKKSIEDLAMVVRIKK